MTTSGSRPAPTSTTASSSKSQTSGSIMSASTATPSGERSSIASPGTLRPSHDAIAASAARALTSDCVTSSSAATTAGVASIRTGASTRASAERARRSSIIVATPARTSPASIALHNVVPSAPTSASRARQVSRSSSDMAVLPVLLRDVGVDRGQLGPRTHRRDDLAIGPDRSEPELAVHRPDQREVLRRVDGPAQLAVVGLRGDLMARELVRLLHHVGRDVLLG